MSTSGVFALINESFEDEVYVLLLYNMCSSWDENFDQMNMALRFDHLGHLLVDYHGEEEDEYQQEQQEEHQQQTQQQNQQQQQQRESDEASSSHTSGMLSFIFASNYSFWHLSLK